MIPPGGIRPMLRSRFAPAPRFVVRAALPVALLALAACTPLTTWPPVDGAVGLDHPAIPPVPELMVKAIEEIERRSDPTGATSIVFNLPEGTTAGVYATVRRRLPEGARPMLPGDEGVTATVIHVDEVRVRGTRADVDLIHRRGEDGVPALTTVSLQQRIPGGWRVSDVRTWYVTRAEPRATFPVPEPTEVVGADGADSDRTASVEDGGDGE